MHDAHLVGRRHAVGNLPRQRERLRHGQLADTLDDGRERLAGHVAHRDVLEPAELAKVVDAHDVLVRDLPRQQQLALEAAHLVAAGVLVAALASAEWS